MPLDGVVIVSTPQEVALADARRGVNMFKMDSINVPIIGIVDPIMSEIGAKLV